jgi:putative FmdB family regulatory protein
MTYDYVCTACAHAWEAEQRISEAALTHCPACHQATAKRQISGGQGFILKGGGWYSDLYSSAKPAASADSAKESKSEAKAESTSKNPSSPCPSGACGTSACPAASAAS